MKNNVEAVSMATAKESGLLGSSQPEVSVTHPGSPGILKSDSNLRKQVSNSNNNSVTFSAKTDVKLIEGKQEKSKRVKNIDIKKQSKEILKKSIRSQHTGSDSDGYHSDCKSESPRKRVKKPYPKRLYLDKSGNTTANKGSLKIKLDVTFNHHQSL